MPRLKKNILDSLTVADLKALLANKQAEALQARKAELEADLARVEKELAQLLKGGAASTPGRAKRAKKSAAKPAKKKAGKKKAAGKAAAKSRSGGGATIESVVVSLLKSNGEPMAFQDIMATIKKQKLIKTKAADFTNVLRRTFSTSKKIKRVGRGIYRA